MNRHDIGGQFRYLIDDRDAKLTGIFDTDFDAADMQILKTPIRAPRVKAISERFVGSIRRELLDRILILNRRHATAALRGSSCMRDYFKARRRP